MTEIKINHNFKDEIGNIYGRLTVLKRHYENNSRGQAQWVCECECENIHTVLGMSLRNGRTQSCGCLNDEVRASRASKATNAWRLSKGTAAFRIALRVYKRNANGRNLLWDLSDEEAYDLMQQDCFYCGEVPSMVAGSERTNGIFLYNGLDRIDNDDGYYIKNVVPCCNTCNLAKREQTMEEFISWVHRVSKHMKPGVTA